MKYGYDQPLVIQSGPQELKIAKVTSGVTTIELADGHIIRVTLRIDRVVATGDDISIAFSTISEAMMKPEFPVADAPEMLQ